MINADTPKGMARLAPIQHRGTIQTEISLGMVFGIGYEDQMSHLDRQCGQRSKGEIRRNIAIDDQKRLITQKWQRPINTAARFERLALG
jgi:hypothetical protein